MDLKFNMKKRFECYLIVKNKKQEIDFSNENQVISILN